MELCVVKHKVKTNNGNSTRKKVWAVMIRKILEQKRTTVVLRFVHYASVQPWSLLDCTCGKTRWGLEDGARGRVEGDYEGMHKCEIDI